MRLRLLAEAEAEIAAATKWLQRRARMGKDFGRAISAALLTIERQPRSFGPPPRLPAGERRDVRHYVVRRFKYLIVYCLLNEDDGVVVACYHGRRKPNYWMRRLNRPG